ncbi:MAG: hypothetical protein GY765_20095 [bacterium]|nr:hypothetical protein [bacterium]
MFFKKRKKLMVLGIDGVPFELLQTLTQSGVMPNVKRLMNKHGLTKTQVPLPEISSVSWTSFMTGKNPGAHGIYGFMEIDHKNYSYSFPSFPSLPVKTVWETIGEKKNKSVILNLPNTYPARPLQGALVSGFVALDLDKAVYPKSLLPHLKKIDYRIDVDNATAKTDKKLFLKDLRDTLDTRYDLFKFMREKEKWNLFFLIITGTDRLHHFFYDAFDNPDSPFHQDFLDYYRRVDTILGEISDDMEKKEIPFIILSDHGFTKIKQEVYLSQYLKEWGYLHLEGETGGIKDISKKTSAFVLDPSRLYIHLEGKYSRGSVKKEAYEPLRAELKEKFLNLVVEGEKAIKQVFYKEEIYSGKYLENAPDLVLLSNYGFDLKSGLKKSAPFGRTVFEGMHTYDNAVLIDGAGLDLKEHPYIYDIGKGVEEYFA